jgi:hypothetical protein
VNELVEAADDKNLARTIARYGRVDLLMIDELGYMELDRRGAELLFQVLTEQEQNNSITIASNESISGWTKTFRSALRSSTDSPPPAPSSKPAPTPTASPIANNRGSMRDEERSQSGLSQVGDNLRSEPCRVFEATRVVIFSARTRIPIRIEGPPAMRRRVSHDRIDGHFS